MGSDRTLRRLTALQQTASTARVLNLTAIHCKLGALTELEAAPFFTNALLDRSIILKHRLRPNEYAYFSSPKPNATKILTPFDGRDLRLGARSVFIGERDFDEVIEDVFGPELAPGSRDRRVLELMDDLPSLDPFLLREHLRANEIEPARAYFGISDADIQRMFEFVRTEMAPLVKLSSGDASGSHAYASRLVDKLLSTAPDSGFEPLKATLKLNDREYLDGVFSWRGFLYYKWALGDLEPGVERVLDEIERVHGRGPTDAEAVKYVQAAKRRMRAGVKETMARVHEMLAVYDRAYASLTVESKPSAFRDFLLTAPGMFKSLGEQLGAVQHITSFWNYRFPKERPRLASDRELQDIFLDFEDSIAFSGQEFADA